MRIFIKDGCAKFLYDDKILHLTEKMGEADITRASNVEPYANEHGVKWFADMQPSGGPVLGPFQTRAAALAAETSWLENKLRGLYV